MSVHNFDGYSEFSEWCAENNYNEDDQYDEEEESYKRDTNLSFYVKHRTEDVYALVNVLASYDHGWQEGEILAVGLKRIEEQVVTTKVSYV